MGQKGLYWKIIPWHNNVQGNQLLVIAETDYKMKYASLQSHSAKILNYFRPELKEVKFVFCQEHQSFQDVLEDQSGEYDNIDEMTLDLDSDELWFWTLRRVQLCLNYSISRQ